jgi:hypothetical protein
MAELRRRLLASDATLSTADCGQRLRMTAWLIPDTDGDLVLEIERRGWTIISGGRAEA